MPSFVFDPVLWRPMRRCWPALLISLVVVTVFALLSAGQPTWVAPGVWTDSPGVPGAVVADAVSTARPALGAPALVADAGSARRVVLQGRLALGASVLATVWGMLGLAGVGLAATQRQRRDGVFGLSALAWCVHTVLAAPTAPGALGLPVSMPLQQLLMLIAVGSLIWYSVRLLGWQVPAQPRRPMWPAWAAGMVMALVISWSRGVDESSGPWLVPLTCLATGFFVLSRGMSEGAADHAPRTVGFWWVTLGGAVAIGCGTYEIWLRIAHPHLVETRATLWLLTRATVVLLMGGLLLRRLGEVASNTRQLGRSHHRWRERLRRAQAEMSDLQQGMALRDAADRQRLQRDQVAREVLDELLLTASSRPASACGDGARGGAARAAPPAEDALHGLRWVRDSLDLAPRSLDEALHALRDRLDQRLAAVGGRIDWHIDPATRGVVLPAGETLLWQRLADEAVSVAISLGWSREPVALQVAVHEGETGRHLQLALGPTHAPGPQTGGGVNAAAAFERDLFGAPIDPAVTRSHGHLQRLATALGAQLVFAAQPDEPGGLEVVKPLKWR